MFFLKGKFNFKSFAQLMDATYVLRRPANEQYLSSQKAVLRFSKDAWTVAISFFFCLAATGLEFYTLNYALVTFKLSFLNGLGALLCLLAIVGLIFIWAMFALDLTGVFLPYRLEFQRESHGGRTWATVKDLEKEDVDAIRKAGADTKGKGVLLAPFKHFFSFGEPEPKFNVFLSLQRMAQAMIIYGPPGSGKSSTFFIPVIRQFADCGGAIVLDVKGELFNYSAHYYSNVFRLDIMNPLNSDWFDLFGSCYRNPDLANRIAGYMVGYDPNKNSSKEPIWDQSAVSMLAAMILFLCEKKEHPTPRDILRFLAENPKAATRQKRDEDGNPLFDGNGNPKMEPYSPLNLAFEKCPYPFVRDIWTANFAEMPKDTFGSVKFNADTAIKQLLSPKVNEILRPPTEGERKKGRRRINFTHLRQMFEFGKEKGEKRGTAIYIVVSPSDAMNMDVFLRVVFSVALDTLRESAKEGCRVLVALDEAGNVPLSKMPEGINTDRSKGICYFLGYQDEKQPDTQYGRDAASTFKATAGVNIFLPGIDDSTAELASKRLGETTILQRSSSDAKNDGFDHEKVSEAGRKLMLPQELTEMKWFTQCIITIKGAAPIRTKIPNDSKMQDTRITEPQRIVDDVSEEVLRLLQIKTGRDDVIEVRPTVIEQNEPKSQRQKDIEEAAKKAETESEKPVSQTEKAVDQVMSDVGFQKPAEEKEVSQSPMPEKKQSAIDFLDDDEPPMTMEPEFNDEMPEDEIEEPATFESVDEGLFDEPDVTVAPITASDDFIDDSSDDQPQAATVGTTDFRRSLKIRNVEVTNSDEEFAVSRREF